MLRPLGQRRRLRVPGDTKNRLSVRATEPGFSWFLQLKILPTPYEVKLNQLGIGGHKCCGQWRQDVLDGGGVCPTGAYIQGVRL